MNAPTKLLLALTAASALSFTHPASANLITNPGFETGDFTGWNAGAFWSVQGSAFGISPHSGSFQAVFSSGTNVPIGLFQSVATTPGASYTVDFFLAHAAGSAGNIFTASFGGVGLLTLTN
jgi:hypothetical protein